MGLRGVEKEIGEMRGHKKGVILEVLWAVTTLILDMYKNVKDA